MPGVLGFRSLPLVTTDCRLAPNPPYELGVWTMKQYWGFIDFALFLHSVQYAEYRYCADVLKKAKGKT